MTGAWGARKNRGRGGGRGKSGRGKSGRGKSGRLEFLKGEVVEIGRKYANSGPARPQ